MFDMFSFDLEFKITTYCCWFKIPEVIQGLS